ncbi:MAG: hypothetical protein PHR44_03000 [Candidatus Omnitrophica bacterium]|nr:hypothetical protein [Candidatus Omnitrophota bacterium]
MRVKFNGIYPLCPHLHTNSPCRVIRWGSIIRTMIIYEEVLREFQKQKVRYVLVGGIAFNLLGGYRSTFDMDIIVEMTDTNLRGVVQILKKSGFRLKQPIDPISIADKDIRDDLIRRKHIKAINFYKDKKSYEEIDIIIKSPVDFKRAIKNAKRIKVGRLALPVIAPADLIKMKKAIGRSRDKEDIKELRTIQRMK